MYRELLHALASAFRACSPRLDAAAANRRAERALVWEGDVRRRIHQFEFLGVPHRPDFEVVWPGTKVAIEVKRGDTGGEVRAGIGQALVYSQVYDFVIYLFIDATEGRIIRTASADPREAAFAAHLWRSHNVYLIVV